MYDTIQKTIIAWAFNHYIACYYFDNVNVSQLKVAFENGLIELENLSVNREALRQLKLPWDVYEGTVGQLSIRIPLLTLLTDPWLIRISNLVLVVCPKELRKIELNNDADESRTDASTSFDVLQDKSDAALAEYLEYSNTENDDNGFTAGKAINSEETKLAEFYKSFSATVSSVVKDIYKNIKLEIESMSIVFKDFNHGLARLSADNLVLHRPESVRKVVMDNVSFYMSSLGTYKWTNNDDFLRVNLNTLSLEVYDVSHGADYTSLEINSETNIYGNLFIVGSLQNSSIPLSEFLLEDCRILYFSGKHQQDWSAFARASCSHFNRETSTWDSLMKPWPFNLSWDKKLQQRKISLTSDEPAEFTLSNALIDLFDVVFKRISTEPYSSISLPLTALSKNTSHLREFNIDPIFVLHNQTGHRLFYVSLDECHDGLELVERSKSASPSDGGESGLTQAITHKLSISSRSSGEDRDSIEWTRLTHWTAVENNETISFDLAKFVLVRVVGWKALAPIPLDRTGLFFREACSDRVKNEDTCIVVSIDLEDNSARKIITIRSPLNLVNSLDTTLEIQFDDDYALYIKPECQVSVPLPYIFNRMFIRPCNLKELTFKRSDQPITWDNIGQVPDFESRIHICQPITMTDKKQASYCTSRAYRICASLRRDGLRDEAEKQPEMPVSAFQLSFLPPLTIVNLLPCELKYLVAGIDGSLGKGSQQKIHYVDTTRVNEISFEMNGFPRSKSIRIDPGATGSFQYTLEMIDRNHRSLYLNAKIILASHGEEPAVQVIISAPFWFINKTKLPLVFKQEGAALEAAGQSREHEDKPSSTLLFSFYDAELEPPWLCSMRLGKSRGLSNWCDGFKLEKGSGQRRLNFIPNKGEGDSKLSRSMIDINVRRGLGRYSDTMIVTFTTRYGFDCLAKTPKKAYDSSPQDYKLSYYNCSTNLAQQIGGRSVRQLFTNHSLDNLSDVSFIGPGLKVVVVDNQKEKIIELTVDSIVLKSTTQSKEQIVDCSIQDIRIENSLPECEKNVVLDRAASFAQGSRPSPALRLIIDRIIGKSFGTVWFRQVQLSMSELMLNIEEKLFLKLVEFVSFRNKRRPKDISNLERDLDRLLHPEEERLSKYYFDLLRIDLSSVKLSCFTATNLPNSLQRLKSLLGVKFFSFEDAQVQLSPYFKMNVSRTLRGISDSISRFYKRQISEQAPRIVGQQIQNYLRFHLSDLLSSLYDEVYNKLFY